MKIELDNIEVAHISSLITTRRETIAKILNAIQEDNDVIIKHFYEDEDRIMSKLQKRLWEGVRNDDYKEKRA